MRRTFFLMSSAVLVSAAGAGPASAQMGREANADPVQQGQIPPECAGATGRFLDPCIDRVRRAERKKGGKDDATAVAGKKGGASGLSKADTELVNGTNASAQAKLQANDFAGAVADYQKAIEASPNNPARHILYAGLAMSLRRQAIAAYNAGTRPTPPAVGASNDEIRAYNAAVATQQTQRTAETLPLLKRAIEAAATAATGADASDNKAADPTIAVELLEDARLLFQLEPQGVLATPRASVDVETTWFRRWLTTTPPPSQADIAKYGFAVAAALTAKDAAAGLTLADEIQSKAGSGIEQALAYAEIVAAGKTPAGDPRRAKALAGLAAIEGSVIEAGQRERLAKLKTALAT